MPGVRRTIMVDIGADPTGPDRHSTRKAYMDTVWSLHGHVGAKTVDN